MDCFCFGRERQAFIGKGMQVGRDGKGGVLASSHAGAIAGTGGGHYRKKVAIRDGARACRRAISAATAPS